MSKDGKSVRISVTIPKDVHDKLGEIRDSEDLKSVSLVAARMLRAGVETYPDPKQLSLDLARPATRRRNAQDE